MRSMTSVAVLLVFCLPIVAQPKTLQEAKRAWNDSRKGSEDGQIEALRGIAALGSLEALRLMLDELGKDQKARRQDQAKDDLLPARVRSELIAALGTFADPASVSLIGDSAIALKSMDSPPLAVDQLDLLTPLAAMKTPHADKTLLAALAHKHNAYLKCAALEAIRRAKRDTFTTELLAVLGEKNEAWLGDYRIVTLNVLDCLRDTVDKSDSASVVRVLEALLAMDAWATGKKIELDERVLAFAQRTLEALTGEKWALKATGLWRWWMAQQSGGVAPRPKAESPNSTRPPAFDIPIVGRVAFLIDVSKSMEEELPAGVREKAGGKLPWEKIKTKLDLARHELAASILRLADPGPRPATKFAIVLYSKEVQQFTSGWVTASPQACEEWAGKARTLQPGSITNIHGALLAGLRISDKGISSEHPSVDKDCVATGADSFILLTDGWASWCDDSKGYTTDKRNNAKDSVGDGKFIYGPEIAQDILRVNAFRKVIINTVGIGFHDSELLKALTTGTGGTYVNWSGK